MSGPAPCLVRGCVALAGPSGYCTVHRKNRGYAASQDTAPRVRPSRLRQDSLIADVPPDTLTLTPADHYDGRRS